ncbi:MAG: ribonuclease J [Butyrivibrio sp.]|nr:ribonuclease J [Butyrivibrio sp.]
MSDSIKIIPLGGFDKIGMNMLVIEYGGSMIIVDCGTSFPPHNMPGVDTAIPDTGYIIKNKDKLKGIVLTHGHEDHIGAIPYLIENLAVPVYGTPLTIALVEKKLEEHKIKKYRTKVIRQGSSFILGDFRIEFIKANHSIPDAVMLAIYTPQGMIIHTGDFKIDYTPITGDSIDLKRLAALGSKGVLAVLADSTNALVDGSSPSESEVSTSLDNLINKYRENRLIIATFASNMDRVQQIIKLAKKHKKKVVLLGETMLGIFEAAKKLDYLNLLEGVLIDVSEISNYNNEDLIFLTTGNHGEPINCLNEIAEGMHEHIKLCRGDTILFSSIAIHGSEHIFSKTMNLLEEQGANIVFQDLHATGHACSEELKLIYTLTSPKYVIPAHGEYRYRKASANIAESIGIPRENIFLINNGDVLEISDEATKVTDHIKLKEILIDGLGIGKVGRSVLAERKKLAKEGIVIASICIDVRSKRLVAPPNIVTKGFWDEQKSKDFIEKSEEVLYLEISRLISQGVFDERFSVQIKKALEKSIWERTMQRPFILVLINNVML